MITAFSDSRKLLRNATILTVGIWRSSTRLATPPLDITLHANDMKDDTYSDNDLNVVIADPRTSSEFSYVASKMVCESFLIEESTWFRFYVMKLVSPASLAN